jgi:hypothetical protein
MAEDGLRHVDLTASEGAPGDNADVLWHLEPEPQSGCGWPVGGCHKDSPRRPWNGTPALS